MKEPRKNNAAWIFALLIIAVTFRVLKWATSSGWVDRLADYIVIGCKSTTVILLLVDKRRMDKE